MFGGGDGGKGLCERVVALCTRGIGRAGSHDSPMEGWHQQRVCSGYVKGVWKAFGCQKSCTTSMHCLRNWKSPPRQKVTMNMFSISPDRADFTSSSLLPALSANEYLVCQSSQPPQLNRPSPSPCLWVETNRGTHNSRLFYGFWLRPREEQRSPRFTAALSVRCLERCTVVEA